MGLLQEKRVLVTGGTTGLGLAIAARFLNCRFLPSCSDYAIEAFRCHGGLRGGMLAAGRILRCNPWCVSGYDPVPPSARDAPTTGRAAAPRPGRGGGSEPDTAAQARPEYRQMGH